MARSKSAKELMYACHGIAGHDWRKETEKSKVFCGVVGLDGRCSAQAERRKKPCGSWPTTGCLPVNRNKLGPDSWRDEKGV